MTIKNSDELYPLIFESTGSAMAVIDQNNLIILANRQFSRLTGYKETEIINNLRLTDLVYENDLGIVTEQSLPAFEKPDQNDSEFELRLKTAAGDIRNFSIHIALIPKTSNRIVSIFDITKRKHAEMKLKISENKYKKIFENVQDVYYQTDLNGTIIEISPSIKKYSGFSREELIGTPVQNVYSDPEDRDRMIKLIMTNGDVSDYELLLITKDNREVITSASSHLINNSDGSPIGIEGSLRDISDRKRNENIIKTLLKEKELLLKETHHRIKNNMNTVYAFLYMQAEQQNDDMSSGILKNAASRVQSMMVLYDKLYRSEEHHELNINDYLPSLVNEIINLFDSPVPIKTDLHIDDFILSAKILSSLGIIINELITNSVKHAFSKTEKGLISLSAKLKDDIATITYTDNGTGLKLPGSYRKDQTFGMQLVDILVKQINGSVTIDNKNGARYIIQFKVLMG